MNQRAQQHTWKNYLRSVALLLLGISLFYLAVRKQQWSSFWSILKTGDYHLVPFILLVSMASYWFRNERWRLLVDSSGHEPRRIASLAALSVGYLVNYAIPRLGELTRCYLIKRRQNIPVELSLGTVVAERLIDIIMLFLVVVVAFVIQFHPLNDFAQQHIWPGVYAIFSNQTSWTVRLIVLLGVAIITFILLRWTGNKMIQSVRLSGFVNGLKSVFRLRQRILFVAYTFGIWLCYFLMTYLWSFSFESTGHIGMVQAFVVMTAGTLGRSLPIQGGGFGAYHFMVTQMLLVYGIQEENGFALAVLIHAAQTIFSILMGVWGYLYFSFTKRIEVVN
jgi:uncharacterized protein (TIRG00374 family)